MSEVISLSNGSVTRLPKRTLFQTGIPVALKKVVIASDPARDTPPYRKVVTGTDATVAAIPITSPPITVILISFRKPNCAKAAETMAIIIAVPAYAITVGTAVSVITIRVDNPTTTPYFHPHSTAIRIVPIESR